MQEGHTSFRSRHHVAKDKSSYPSVLHADGTPITVDEIKAAGGYLELLYLSDQIQLNATGSSDTGTGRIEGLIIRQLQHSHGISEAQYQATNKRLSVASGGRILKKQPTAGGCPRRKGHWGIAAMLVIPGGWESIPGAVLMDGNTVVAKAPAASSSSSSSSAAAAAATAALRATLAATAVIPGRRRFIEPSAAAGGAAVALEANGDSWCVGGEAGTAAADAAADLS